LINPQGSRTTFGYDAADRRTVKKLGNTARTSFSYDSADRLTRLVNLKSSGVTISSFSYRQSSEIFLLLDLTVCLVFKSIRKAAARAPGFNECDPKRRPVVALQKGLRNGPGGQKIWWFRAEFLSKTRILCAKRGAFRGRGAGSFQFL
jgi:uncharacterized protein RhaS with RHS repeats